MSKLEVLVLRRWPGRVRGRPATAMAAVLGVALSFSAAAQPSAPSGLAAMPGDAEATLSWDPSNDAITGYSVRYAASAAALAGDSVAWTPISDSGTATVEHTVLSLANGARYYFQVRAASADGDGPPSNVATIRLAASPTDAAAINDSSLRSALEQSVGVTAGAVVTQLDVATLVSLRAPSIHVSDLSGLEHAVNLRQLDLSYNAISDVSALSSLESLANLRLIYNTISDVSPLGALECLTSLDLSNNMISDVSALSSLQSLASLTLATTRYRTSQHSARSKP